MPWIALILALLSSPIVQKLIKDILEKLRGKPFLKRLALKNELVALCKSSVVVSELDGKATFVAAESDFELELKKFQDKVDAA